MIRTRVGYAGGRLKDPTYYRLGDHTETIQIDYDPKVISYEDLLKVFWQAHNPTGRSWSKQYRSVILFHDAKQKRAAEASLAREAERQGAKIHTDIEPLTKFYRAEDYHQKYLLRSARPLVAELRAIYPDWDDLVDSTAAARVNGYLGGHGGRKQLEDEAPELGLSPQAMAKLESLVARGGV